MLVGQVDKNLGNEKDFFSARFAPNVDGLVAGVCTVQHLTPNFNTKLRRMLDSLCANRALAFWSMDHTHLMDVAVLSCSPRFIASSKPEEASFSEAEK